MDVKAIRPARVILLAKDNMSQRGKKRAEEREAYYILVD